MFAGAWYMRMAYLMEVGQRAVVNLPEASGVKRSADDLFGQSFVERFALPASRVSGGAGGLGLGSGEFNVVGGSGEEGSGGNLFTKVRDGFKKLGEKFNPDPEALVKKMLSSAGSAVQNYREGVHPILEMKRIGAWLLGAGSIMFLVYMGFLVAASLLKSGVGAAISAGMLVVTGILFPMMITTGFTLSYVLPMMPFMIWIGVFLGWIILCVEAIIAAPVWAVMHLSPSGDDLVGTAGQGYRLVLSLVLRPVLMVFGLIASLTIIQVFAPMISRVFMDVFVLSQQDTGILSLLFGFLAAPMLYLGFMWVLITKSLNLIHILPDQLLQWFGGGGPQLGDYGQTFGGQGSQAFAAIGTMGQTFSRSIDAVRNIKDLKQQFKQGDHAAAQTHLAAIETNKKKIDGIAGSGSGDIIEKSLGPGALKRGRGSSESVKAGVDAAFGGAAQMRAVEMLDQASEALGGSNTPEAVAFRENMNADMSAKADGTPGMTFDEAYEKNFNKSLEEKYGSAGAQYLKKSTGGKFSGSEFDRSMKRLDYVSKFYDKMPPSQKLQKINNLFEEAEGIAKRNPSKGLTEAVDDAIDKAFEKSKSGDKSFGGFQRD